MKKLICILAGAALLGACEQKTEVVAPASSPAPEAAAMGQKPRRDAATLSTAATPAVSTETKTETTETKTETTESAAESTPSP